MHTIEDYSDPYYKDHEGLTLVVDEKPVAHVVSRGGKMDMIFAIHGPLDFQTAKTVVVGLLDLLVHHENATRQKA